MILHIGTNVEKHNKLY